MGAPATSELRIPADAHYILVAKRAAAAFGYMAGFGVEAIDDLVIAVSQACENAIIAADRSVGEGRGQVRLAFKLEERRLEVQVRSICSRAGEADAACAPTDADVERQRLVAAAAEERAAVRRSQAAYTDLALRVMGLFVDDCRYRVDERTGGLRVRLTKYRAS